jgi:VWFA-related protein
VRILAAIATATVLSLAGSPVLSSQQAQPAPTFKTGVDLLTLQASVLDKKGQPVKDLQESDFSVTVEGKARKVLFARYRGAGDPAGGGANVTGPAAAAASHASNTATAGGRLVMFVVDRESMKRGSEKALLESSATILDSLSPADAVGVLTVPVGGVDPTRDHARVREELKRISGTQPVSVAGIGDKFITWDEALGYERQDRTTIQRVMERECRQSEGPRCAKELEDQARSMLFEGRGHVRTVLQSLAAALKAIGTIRGPKYIVLLSGGQAFDQELLSDYNEFARNAAAAQVMLHAVHIDQPGGDTTERRSVSSGFGGRDLTAGLMTMTGMTGGAYYSGVGTAAGVFERIRTEITNDYELGLEAGPADADGKLHDVEVKVKRPDVSVRARKQILLAKDALAPSADAIVKLLGQPTDIADLPISIATYATRGQEAATLRVLLSAEIGGPQSGAASEWAFAIFDKDKLIADGRQELTPEGPRGIVTTSLQLAPGRYRLRIVATAPGGRAGVLNTPLTVGLRAAGPLQLSDLIVGTAVNSRVQPQSRLFQGQRLAALVEMISADTAALEKTRAAMEILPVGGTEPVQRLLMAMRGSGFENVVFSEAQVDTTSLAPGRYVASAIALVDTQPVGRVSRVFEVVAEPVK